MAQTIPQPIREFRGVWVATVDNIDWPSKRGLPVEQQKAELLAIIEKTAELNLNAVILQVRPACDALYKSDLEPWSEYLTGTMGKAPSPMWDPLQFAIDQCHKRGLELHAWFNPYRARHPSSKSPISPNHISKTHPELVRTYGKHLWLDPGEKGVQDYSAAVVADVVKRYDLDGIHIDDYFYPYKERGENNKIIDFPDDVSYARYTASGGRMKRDDWRRENVNTFVERIYKETKATKPFVKFGISPFGIWRPGYPKMVKGFDAYVELYADSKKWLNNGWCDYLTPQLYWRLAQTSQPYADLLRWWVDENKMNRHIWPGQYTSKTGEGEKGWPADEIVNQIIATRQQPGATGTVHFSAKAFLRNWGGISDALKTKVYQHKALIPASPWIEDTKPPAPSVTLNDTKSQISWKSNAKDPVFVWVVYTQKNSNWDYQILPAEANSVNLSRHVDSVSVSAVDRNGNESERASAATKTRINFN